MDCWIIFHQKYTIKEARNQLTKVNKDPWSSIPKCEFRMVTNLSMQIGASCTLEKR